MIASVKREALPIPDEPNGNIPNIPCSAGLNARRMDCVAGDASSYLFRSKTNISGLFISPVPTFLIKPAVIPKTIPALAMPASIKASEIAVTAAAVALPSSDKNVTVIAISALGYNAVWITRENNSRSQSEYPSLPANVPYVFSTLTVITALSASPEV